MSLSFAVAALSALSMVAQDGGAAQCVAPHMPEPVRSTPPALPTVPDCVDLVAQTAECSGDQVAVYNAAVEAYTAENNAHVARVNAYIAQLRTFQQEASTYAVCESQAYPSNTEAPVLIGAPPQTAD